MKSKAFFTFIFIITVFAVGCNKNSSNDKNKPFIILNGSSLMSWPKGSEFVDPGAFVYDVTEMNDTIDISFRLNTSSNVNTDMEGDYEVKYNAEDEAGNKADEKTRSVRVLITK